jgi:transcriptional regulator with XRE-family HTH domain
MPSNWSIDPILKAVRNTKGIQKQCSAIRERMLLSRAAVAEMLGYPESKLQAMEWGKRPVTLELLAKLAEIAKMPLTELYKIDPGPLANAHAVAGMRKARDIAKKGQPRAGDRAKMGRRNEVVPTFAPPGHNYYGSGVEGDALASALDRMLGDVDITLLPPTVPKGAHLATARFQGRTAFAGTGPTKGTAIAKAIGLAKADLDDFHGRRRAAE